MPRTTSLAKLRVPVGGQEIELQEIDYDDDGPVDGLAPAPSDASADASREVVPMRMLRTRIRERSRFTVFDIDPLTAEAWGRELLQWAQRQPRG